MIPINNIKCVQLNCRGVNSRLSELRKLLNKENPTVLALCETWLNDNSRKIPKFPGYNCVWENRESGTGGGLGLLVRSEIQYRKKPIIKYRQGEMETHVISLFHNSEEINILNVYNPIKNVSVAELKHYINQLGSKFLIVGDLNVHTPILDDRVITPNSTGRSLERVILDEDVYLMNPRNLYTYLCTRTGKKVLS